MKKKIIAILLAATMAVTMTAFVTALAVDGNNNGVEDGTESAITDAIVNTPGTPLENNPDANDQTGDSSTVGGFEVTPYEGSEDPGDLNYGDETVDQNLSDDGQETQISEREFNKLKNKYFAPVSDRDVRRLQNEAESNASGLADKTYTEDNSWRMKWERAKLLQEYGINPRDPKYDIDIEINVDVEYVENSDGSYTKTTTYERKETATEYTFDDWQIPDWWTAEDIDDYRTYFSNSSVPGSPIEVSRVLQPDGSTLVTTTTTTIITTVETIDGEGVIRTVTKTTTEIVLTLKEIDAVPQQWRDDKAAFDQYEIEKEEYDGTMQSLGTPSSIVLSGPSNGYGETSDPTQRGNTVVDRVVDGNNRNNPYVVPEVITISNHPNQGGTITVAGGVSGYAVLEIHIGNSSSSVYYLLIDLNLSATYTLQGANHIGLGLTMEPAPVQDPGPPVGVLSFFKDKDVTVSYSEADQYGVLKYTITTTRVTGGSYTIPGDGGGDGPGDGPSPTPSPSPSPTPDIVIIEELPVPLIPFIPGPAPEGEDEAEEAEEEEIVTIAAPIVPLAPPGEGLPITSPVEEIVSVPPVEIPLVEIGGSSWHLWNLILSVAGIAMAIAMGIRAIAGNKKKEDEQVDENPEDRKKNLILSLMVPVAAIAACIVFILTQDLTAPMAYIDRWTALHAGLFAAGLMSFVFADRKVKDEETATA